jgi:SAM-dependent methyltransferase
MKWHDRYLQQAAWTRDLRAYLFRQAGLDRVSRVLEVGCGTGAIVQELHIPASIHGLDLDSDALHECRHHAPSVTLAVGDGHHLPYPDASFDIVYCHFLLLWVRDPLQVLYEMARTGRNVLALAEPDYSRRVDEPAELRPLGRWQAESLSRQGADPTFGSRLAETFRQAGLQLVEAGPIQSGAGLRTDDDWEKEWSVIEADLEDFIPSTEIQTLRILDAKAREKGERVLNVPTYFAWGRT